MDVQESNGVYDVLLDLVLTEIPNKTLMFTTFEQSLFLLGWSFWDQTCGYIL